MAQVFIEEEPIAEIMVTKSKKKKTKEPVLKYIDYSYDTTLDGKFKSKNELFTSYIELKKQYDAEAQKKISNLIK